MQEAKTARQLLDMLLAGQPQEKKEIDPTTLRYALYARKSTTSEDSQVHSIEDQISECMEHIVIPKGLNVEAIYQESFSAKESGTREEFKRMIDDIKNGKINGIIAWHPDRLARNMKDSGEIIDLVDKGWVTDLKFKTFTFENTAEGKMTLGITFVMAKQYSEHLSDNVNRGNAKNVTDRGEFIGKFKHGYIIDSNRRFQPDTENFTKVKHIFKMILEGKSQKEAREWINKQDYTVQKRPGQDAVPHKWTKDNVSELLRDPHYAGVHKWGKNYSLLEEFYDFSPMITVDEFLKINKIDNLDSSRVISIQRPKSGNIKANLMRGKVYCGSCNKTLTSMLIPHRDKETGKVTHARYYYKCETQGCKMFNKSARASYILDEANKFFSKYLFTTKSNYDVYMQNAREALKKENIKLDSEIASYKTKIGVKEAAHEQSKALIQKDSSLVEVFDVKAELREINSMKAEYERMVNVRRHSKEALPTYEKYLKLFETTPVILNKIRDMKTMDALLRIFFSNFTITAEKDSFARGSKVTYKLNEPWNGFVKSQNFVSGAGEGTLTPGLILGKDAL